VRDISAESRTCATQSAWSKGLVTGSSRTVEGGRFL
jgi:hypothetical protein